MPFHNYHVLLVDADAGVLQTLQIAFELEGFVVHRARTQHEGFTQLLEPKPDAVVVGDIDPVPHASLNFISDARIIFTGFNTPLVMASRRASQDDQRCGLAVGADLYLTQPCRPQDFVFKVMELLARQPEA